MFELAFCSGLRIGDIVKIRTRDLHGNTLIYKAEKTDKIGTVELTRDIATRLRKNSRWGWCFPSPKKIGAHITRQAAWQRVKRAAVRANVNAEGVSPHSFRKNFAVELLKREGLSATQKALQHSDISTTEIYALSDFLSEENFDKPLLRGDVPRLIAHIIAAIGGLQK